MTIAQIQYFLEVAKYESFSRAAEALFVSHQVLSNQIKAIEKELDIELFDRRNKRNLRLTDAGKVLFEAWSEALKISDEAVATAKVMHDTQKKTIVVGIQDMKLVRNYVVPMIRKLETEAPQYSIEYRLSTPEEMISMLNSRTIDMMIMISSDLRNSDRYQKQVISTQNLNPVFAISKHHPLAKRKKINFQDLDGETVLMIGDDYSRDAMRRFQEDLDIYQVKPKRIRTFNSPRAINIAIETEMGIAVIFDEFLEEGRDEIKIYPASFSERNRDIQMLLVWKNRNLDEMATLMTKS